MEVVHKQGSTTCENITLRSLQPPDEKEYEQHFTRYEDMMVIKVWSWLHKFPKMSKLLKTSAAGLQRQQFIPREYVHMSNITILLTIWLQLCWYHPTDVKKKTSSSRSLIISYNMCQIPSNYRVKSRCLPFFLGKLTVWRLVISERNLWEGFTLIERRGQGLVLPEVEGCDSGAEDSLIKVSTHPWYTGVFTFGWLDLFSGRWGRLQIKLATVCASLVELKRKMLEMIYENIKWWEITWWDILACHSMKNTGVNNTFNDGCFPFSCFCFRVTVTLSWLSGRLN